MLKRSEYSRGWLMGDVVAAAFGAAVLFGIAVHSTGPGGATSLGRVLELCAAAGILFLAWEVPLSIAASGALLTSTFAGNWQLMGLPSSIGPERVLFAIVLVRALARTRRRQERVPWSVGHWLLVVLLLYATASAIWVGTIETRDGIVLLLDRLGVIPIALFALSPVIFRTRVDRSRVLVALAGLGTYLAFTAWMEMLGIRGAILPHYISDPSLGYQYGRARGPFLESVANGMALFDCGVAAAMLFALSKNTRTRTTAAACVAFCASALPLTLTRSIWIGSAVGIAAALVCTPSLRRTALRFAPAAGVLVLPLVLVGGFSTALQARSSDQFPIWDRINTDAAAIRMIQARPMLGFGWDTFEAKNAPYFVQTGDTPLSSGVNATVHNVFLGTAVELGVVGLAIWVTALLGLFGWIVVHPERGVFTAENKAWRAGTVAVLAQWVVVANLAPLGYVLPNLVLWLMCGVCWGLLPAPAPSRASPGGRRASSTRLRFKLGRGSSGFGDARPAGAS